LSKLATTAGHIYSQKPTLSRNLQTQTLLLSRYLLNLHKVHATILLVLESLDRFQSLRRRRRRRREETQTQTYKNASDSHLALVAIVTRSSSIQKLVSNNSELLLLITAISPKDSIIEIFWNHPSKDHNKRKCRIRRTQKICLYTT
jgi:hypothetical protein